MLSLRTLARHRILARPRENELHPERSDRLHPPEFHRLRRPELHPSYHIALRSLHLTFKTSISIQDTDLDPVWDDWRRYMRIVSSLQRR
jgi:hypothetical protein